MAKLTLSVDPTVVSRAKRYASQRGTSVSQIVEAYLSSLGTPTTRRRTPVLDLLRGSLKKANVEDYKKRMARKYL